MRKEVLRAALAVAIAAAVLWVAALPGAAASPGEVAEVTIYVLEYKTFPDELYRMVKFAANGGWHLFAIVVENVNVSYPGIHWVNITLPAELSGSDQIQDVRPIPPPGWILEERIDDTNTTLTFAATGQNQIGQGEYEVFLIAIKVPETLGTTTPFLANFSLAWNSSAGTTGYVYPITLAIDNAVPTIGNIEPPDGSYVNYAVVNFTVTDNMNLTYYLNAPAPPSDVLDRIESYVADDTAMVPSPWGVEVLRLYTSVYANRSATTYEYFDTRTKWTDYSYNFSFTEKTRIPDGPLTVHMLAVDPAGNNATSSIDIVLDRTPPQIIDICFKDEDGVILRNTTPTTFWMRKDTDRIYAKITFIEPYGVTTSLIYYNCTAGVCTLSFANDTWTTGYMSCPSGTCNETLVYNITIVDNAGNAAVYGPIEILRDLIPPSAPSFLDYKVIRGGVIFHNMDADDNVGEVYAYRVYVRVDTDEVWLNDVSNSSLYTDKELNSTLDHALYWIALSSGSVDSYLIVNLTRGFEKIDITYGRDIANKSLTMSFDVVISLTAIDYGGNEGPPTSIAVTVPAGKWFPIELVPGWNLISLPLIPHSNLSDILELDLNHSIETIFEYDNSTGQWRYYIVGFGGNLDEMKAGVGYWVTAKSTGVLIVEGLVYEVPPGPPRPILGLAEGWNLVGYLSTRSQRGYDYLFSILPGPGYEGPIVFQYAWTWDAEKQKFVLIDLENDELEPGRAYWIYAYRGGAYVPMP